MIQSEVSGVCFTVHPVSKNRNQMVIEAGLGLGEAIVGGLITPDNYIVRKNNSTIQNINVSQQSFYLKRSPAGGTIRVNKSEHLKRQKLADKQIIELAKLCKKIERHYRHPQDIEWAYAEGKFYVTCIGNTMYV